MAGELLLRLLHVLADVVIILLALAPGHAAADIAGSKQQVGDHHLLHRVRVGARGVEYHDALVRAAVKRDIVDARAGPGDGQEALRERHIMHLGAADNNAFRLLGVIRNLVSIWEKLQSLLRNRVQR